MNKISKALLYVGTIAAVVGGSSCYAASKSDNMLLLESLSTENQRNLISDAFDKVSKSSPNLVNELFTQYKDELQKMYNWQVEATPIAPDTDALFIFQELLIPQSQMFFWEKYGKEMIDNILKQLPPKDFSDLLVKYRPDLQDQWEEEEDGDNINPNFGDISNRKVFEQWIGPDGQQYWLDIERQVRVGKPSCNSPYAETGFIPNVPDDSDYSE